MNNFFFLICLYSVFKVLSSGGPDWPIRVHLLLDVLHLLSRLLRREHQTYSSYSVRCASRLRGFRAGGLKWTRTTDLTLIRRVL